MKTLLSNKLFLCAAALAVGILSQNDTHAQPDGTPLWTNRYDGPGNNPAGAAAMAVDSNGNVYVTVSSYDPGSLYDYATLKYSAAGVPIWTNRYNGPGNDHDRANAIGVDANGNVIVTGYSWSGSNYDYATIKYSSAGVALWTNRYNGPANKQDVAHALAVDGSGNVIVTGEAYASNNYPDYATVKYSSGGAQLWANYYGLAYGDQATAVAVDSSNNVFVTGYSLGVSGYDYLTFKYSNAGVPSWTNRYHAGGLAFARALAVDSGGNVFVAGSVTSNSSSNYTTVKYSNAGVPLWTNRYNGPGSNDYAAAMVVDGSGNAFVTGSSWNGSSYDYATIKYASTGLPLWTNRYNGPGNSTDIASAIALDGSNVIVTGYSVGAGYYDFATIKYSSTGLPLWTNRYSGPGSAHDYALSVAVDGLGNVFVAGYAWNGSAYDYVTIKYSGTGGPLLSIARTATNTVAVSWPSHAADFVLQQNSNVVSTNWTLVGITPADDGTNKTVIVDPPEGNRFYRLFHP